MTHNNSEGTEPRGGQPDGVRSFSVGNEYQKPEDYSAKVHGPGQPTPTDAPQPQPLTHSSPTNASGSEPRYDFYGRPITSGQSNPLRSIPQPAYYSQSRPEAGNGASGPGTSGDQSFAYGSMPQNQTYPQQFPTPPASPPERAQTDALISLGAGIIGLITLTWMILGPVALYFGYRARRGGAAASAGIALGWLCIGLFATALVATVAFFVFLSSWV